MTHFDKKYSTKLALKQGKNAVDLLTLHNFQDSIELQQIRLVFDAQDSCKAFSFENPVVACKSIEKSDSVR